MRAVRIAVLVGERVVLAMVGDPGDDRTLDLALKLRWVKWRWKPTVIPTAHKA
jgi:hypothetical protein